MNNSLEILNLFLSKKDTITLFWKYEQGWQVINANTDCIDEKYYESGIQALEPLIVKQEISKFKRFIKMIKSNLMGENKTPNNKDVLEQIFTFNVNNSNTYYKITCNFNYVENVADTVLTTITKLSTEDSYRYTLSQTITNDKNPDSFNIEVQNLFNANPDKTFAIIQFDIEGFKNINSQYGEQFGDELLKYIIDNLKIICNDEQLYTRLTADVFMIVTTYETKQDILDLIEEIRKNLLNYKYKHYRLVFGINYITDKSKILRFYGDGAAIARQSIKGDILKYYAFYDFDNMSNDEDEIWILSHMERALKNKEFQMYLQPKFNVITNKVVGAEALVRWVHPTKGVIPPIKFISLFEKNGFIIKLDWYIWEEACKCLSKWRDENKPIIPISVNVSRKNMIDDSYIEYLDLLIKKYKLEKSYLELEITETIDDKTINRSIDLLKEQGYTLLMDDFGSGYSSLNMLKDTKFDVIKIDRMFLNNFTESDRGQQIIKSTISMSHSIGLDIIAEGVETQEQVQFLSECGCDTVQGFYYAKPMTVSEFNEKYNK
jgi:diguanylate cyclase (GGDEF)-like protein